MEKEKKDGDSTCSYMRGYKNVKGEEKWWFCDYDFTTNHRQASNGSLKSLPTTVLEPNALERSLFIYLFILFHWSSFKKVCMRWLFYRNTIHFKYRKQFSPIISHHMYSGKLIIILHRWVLGWVGFQVSLYLFDTIMIRYKFPKGQR